jgi:hypothetical protein
LQVGVRDLLQHGLDVLVRVQAPSLEHRVLFRLARVEALLLVAFVLPPGESLFVGEVEGLHDLLSRHEGLKGLLGDGGDLLVLSGRVGGLVGSGPIEVVGEIRVIELIELLLALFLEEQLQIKRERRRPGQ